ncbi:MAG: SUMF1/EgtB/PvdO family nonheme iron enzyme [Verrucomicrobiae bacterium]|nr:SUMF1/EgtB/PvdO family nonheme iron enzyme [Verrucomicrobiae bacterium]
MRNSPAFFQRILIPLLVLAALCGGFSPLTPFPGSAVGAEIQPVARAATSCAAIRASIRKVTRQLKKAKRSGNTTAVRRLKKQLRKLKQQLAKCSLAPFIEMVTVGNPGNAADPGNTSDPNVYGAVADTFQIGKHEVTLEQYTAFLNAVAATDTYDLYDPSLLKDSQVAGIQQNGSPGSHTYTVVGAGTRPVTYVDWFAAARFCNWLHNGRPTGAQIAGTTETGAYALNGATSGLSITRESGAKFWIPSEDEWYKAAYHHPNGLGGPADDYYLYPTMSDTPPDNQIGATPNQANVYTTVYSVTQSSSVSTTQNYLTDIGAFSGSPSYYGTFDQGGNVWEWTEGINGGQHALRGSSWDNLPAQSLSSYRAGGGERADTIGFRVAGGMP